MFISGLTFGLAFFFAGFVIRSTRFPSFVLTILARSLFMCLTILVCMASVSASAIAVSYDLSLVDPRLLSILGKVFSSSMAWLSLTGAFFMSVMINGYFQISRKIGPSVLKNWILGKYHEPREEERIFMFLDLKHSTTLAEKLGAIRFSKLCQDFFSDLTYPVLETKGEVSHYIGDEAVLTWKPDPGLRNANCLRCFMLMRAAIEKRSGHYLRHYGIVPEFKAGVHIGPVVGAEVGELKSEIVYHGDVLNTTARITGLCATLDSDLLVSGDLLARLNVPDAFTGHSFGPQLLKGKEHAVEVIALSPAEEGPHSKARTRESADASSETIVRR